MLRALTLCLALALAGGGAAAQTSAGGAPDGAGAAQDCPYRQPAPTAEMTKADEMRAKSEGNPFALVILMRTITEKEPGNALAWRWRGAAESAVDDLGAAFESFGRAIELDPCDPITRASRAGLAERAGRLRIAYDDYTAVLARDPRNHVALRLRGDLLYGAAEMRAALADYDAAIATGSEDVDLLLNRGGLMQEFGRFKDAIADYNRILARDRDNAEALVARGYSEFFLGDFAAAEPDLAAGATLNANAAAWTFLARARLGKADAAKRFVEDTRKLERHSWIGEAAELLRAGAPDDRLIRLAEGDPEKLCDIYFYLGEIALAKGDRARAKTAFLKGADACPKDPVRTNGSLREYVAMAEELKRMK